MVREEGIEPSNPYGYRILSPVRLPISPLPHRSVDEKDPHRRSHVALSLRSTEKRTPRLTARCGLGEILFGQPTTNRYGKSPSALASACCGLGGTLFGQSETRATRL